jgi:AcrR family transcriptional regulator
VRRREQAEASRASLVRAARGCFVEFGYEGTTIAEILSRAGMARGALYHYFPDGKQGIFSAVYRDVDDLLYREIDRLESLPSPLTALRASITAYLQLCCRDDFARITVLDAPRVMAGAEWPRRDGGHGRSFTRLRDHVAAVVAAGELDALDVDTLAAALYGAARDLGAQVAAAPDRHRAAVQAQAVIDRMLRGLARPEHDREA